MSLEHSPARASGPAPAPDPAKAGEGQPDVHGDAAFWHGLIDETEAAAFLGLTIRCLQGWRYKGRGPKFVRVSARCIRYRRSELREFADARLRTSTSDTGETT